MYTCPDLHPRQHGLGKRRRLDRELQCLDNGATNVRFGSIRGIRFDECIDAETRVDQRVPGRLRGRGFGEAGRYRQRQISS